jgi:hypothetical protein
VYTAAIGHPGRRAIAFHTELAVLPDRLDTRANWNAVRLDG